MRSSAGEAGRRRPPRGPARRAGRARRRRGLGAGSPHQGGEPVGVHSRSSSATGTKSAAPIRSSSPPTMPMTLRRSLRSAVKASGGPETTNAPGPSPNRAASALPHGRPRRLSPPATQHSASATASAALRHVVGRAQRARAHRLADRGVGAAESPRSAVGQRAGERGAAQLRQLGADQPRRPAARGDQRQRRRRRLREAEPARRARRRPARRPCRPPASGRSLRRPRCRGRRCRRPPARRARGRRRRARRPRASAARRCAASRGCRSSGSWSARAARRRRRPGWPSTRAPPRPRRGRDR